MGFFITGSGFTTAPTVTQNGTPLTVINWQSTYIIVQAGASGGNVVVTVGNQSGIQAGTFTVSNTIGCN